MMRRQSSDSGFSSMQGSEHSSYRPSRRGSMNLYDNEFDENDEDDDDEDDDENDKRKKQAEEEEEEEKEGSDDGGDEGNYSDDDFERMDSPAAGRTKDPNMFSKTVPIPKNILSSVSVPVGKSLSEPLIKYSEVPIISDKIDIKDEKLSQAEIDRRKSFELIKQRWLVSTVEITESKDSVAVALPVSVVNTFDKEEDIEFTKDRDRMSGRDDDKTNERLKDRNINDGSRESVISEGRSNIYNNNTNYNDNNENDNPNDNDNNYRNNNNRTTESYNETEKSNDREESMISRTKNDKDGDRVLDPGSSSRYDYSDSNSHQSNSFISNSNEGRNSTLKTNPPSTLILHQSSDLRNTDNASRSSAGLTNTEGDGLIGIRLLTTIGSNSMVSSFPPPLSSNAVLTMSQSYDRMSSTSSNIHNDNSIDPRNSGSFAPQRDADPRYSYGTYGIPTNVHSSDYDHNNNVVRRSVTFQSNQETSQPPLNVSPKGDKTSTYFSSTTPMEGESRSNLNRPPFSHIDPQPVHMFQPYNAYPVRTIVSAPLSANEIETSRYQAQDNFDQSDRSNSNIFLSIEDRMARDFKRDTTRQPFTILNQKQPLQVDPPGWPHELPMTAPSSEDLFAQLAMISSASDRRAALANVKAKANTKNKSIRSASTVVPVSVSNSAVNRLEQGTARLSRQMDSLQKEISSLASQPSRGCKVAWNAPGVSADLGSSSKRGGEFSLTSKKDGNLGSNSRRKDGHSYIPVRGDRKEREGDRDRDGVKDRGSRRDPSPYSSDKKDYARSQDFVENTSGREIEREKDGGKGRGRGRGSDRGVNGSRGVANGGKRSDRRFDQRGELVDRGGRSTSKSRSRSGSRSDNGSRMYNQHERNGAESRDRNRDSNRKEDYQRDDERYHDDSDDNNDEYHDKFGNNREKSHDNDVRDAVQKEEDSLAEAYQESRWGLQAMETMQKIVESGTILNQRVRHEVISYPLLIPF